MLRPRRHNPFPRPAYMSKDPTHHRVVTPKSTHFRPASCREVDCIPYLTGWATTAPVDSEACSMIRFSPPDGVNRTFTEKNDIRVIEDENGEAKIERVVIFTFPPGQTCFEAFKHTKSLERTPFFFKGSMGNIARSIAGDRRMNVRQEPDQWIDNLGNKLVRGEW